MFFFYKIDNFIFITIYVLLQNISMAEKRSQIITKINNYVFICYFFIFICTQNATDVDMCLHFIVYNVWIVDVVKRESERSVSSKFSMLSKQRWTKYNTRKKKFFFVIKRCETETRCMYSDGKTEDKKDGSCAKWEV